MKAPLNSFLNSSMCQLFNIFPKPLEGSKDIGIIARPGRTLFSLSHDAHPLQSHQRPLGSVKLNSHYLPPLSTTLPKGCRILSWINVHNVMLCNIRKISIFKIKELKSGQCFDTSCLCVQPLGIKTNLKNLCKWSFLSCPSSP